MQKSNFKIEINLEDLKAILSDENGDLNIKIKNHIIQEFSKRYLKGVFNDAQKSFIQSTVKDMVYSAYKEKELSIELRQWFKDKIQDFMYQELSPGKIIQDYIEKHDEEITKLILESPYLGGLLMKKIDNIFNAEFENKLKEIILERFNGGK